MEHILLEGNTLKNKIFVIYGDNPREMASHLLSTIKIEDFIDKDALIGIKPNLVVAKPSSSGATTSPELVEGVIRYLKTKGFNNIAVLESSQVGDKTAKAFEICGYTEIAKNLGIPLIDLKKDSYKAYSVEGMELNIFDQVMELDYLINMPVLKGHCQTKITCSLKY